MSGAGWRFEPGSLEYPLVVAHRGASGLAPENTLVAFRKGLEVGADAFELDVRLTADGQAVVMHDRKVERTTTGRGLVGSLTLEELKSLDAGSWYGAEFAGERVPTLEEVFNAFPKELPIYVELKAKGPGIWSLAKRVVDIMRRHQRWETTLVASFNSAGMALVRVLEPRIIRGYIWCRRHPWPLQTRWLSPLVNPYWYAPDWGTLTPELLTHLHRRGNPVAAWDLDAGTNMDALKRMKLDAVVTDHPEVLARRKFDTIY